ncbi:hypothetical protein Vadar_021496 [Vaccinium darrowii]|uniref:Uncharacterized protein n=1 Tax=Vaccinium darrowii TaxID=229202 RepID=A0ACB7Y139_9ERIC|nr:hypothetical protein Vadar_021496 [Vaccinium darrowii]
MTRKVDGSELRTILGEEWIRKNTLKIQQHAMSYERATWSSILSLLSSASSTKSLLRQRIQNFYVAFREVYNRQTGWVIPDAELRNDLQISTSIKVILAYRAFVRRRRVDLGYKNIKYSAEDLENFLLDLFEGSPRSLHGDQRK